MQSILVIRTTGPALYEFTQDVTRFVEQSGVQEGLLTLFVQHTSCSLCIQENADPAVRRDLEEFFRRLVPPSDTPRMRWIAHDAEGPDDMPAHIKRRLPLFRCRFPSRMRALRWVAGKASISSSTAMALMLVASSPILRRSDDLCPRDEAPA